MLVSEINVKITPLEVSRRSVWEMSSRVAHDENWQKYAPISQCRQSAESARPGARPSAVIKCRQSTRVGHAAIPASTPHVRVNCRTPTLKSQFRTVQNRIREILPTHRTRKISVKFTPPRTPTIQVIQNNTENPRNRIN